jgi:hypothetical protein
VIISIIAAFFNTEHDPASMMPAKESSLILLDINNTLTTVTFWLTQVTHQRAFALLITPNLTS